MFHGDRDTLRQWSALALVVIALAACLILLGGQSVAEDEPSPHKPWLHQMEITTAGCSQARYPLRSPAAVGDWDGCRVSWPWVISDTDTYRMWYGGQGPGNKGWGWVIGVAESEDGTTWTKGASNPVLELGDEGDWDDRFRGQMAVLKDAGTYKMWYSGGSDVGPWQIGYATSTDGSDWDVYAGNPVLPAGGSGSWEEAEVATPAVIKDGSTYKMWYGGCDKAYSTCSIGFASSTNGVDWTKYAGNPVLKGTAGEWDEGFVGAPMVIKNGSTYEMWYHAGDGQIGRATSANGLAWTKDAGNPIVSTGWDGTGVGFPRVVLEEGTYKMWLVGGESTGIGYADSSDGIDWNMYAGNPVLTPGAPGLLIYVNYDHDWVAGEACGQAVVAVTVADDQGVKATAEGQAQWNGEFATWEWEWDPEQPDIAPGDVVTATWDALQTTVDPVGTVDSLLDYDADTASGTIHAPWFSPQTLTVRCEVWEEGGPQIEIDSVAADGGSFTCDFGAVGWNLQPGPDVGVSYVEPDGDEVIAVPRSLDPFMTVDYGHDWVDGQYKAGHTVWITVTESDGATVKATAAVVSQEYPEWGGWTGFAPQNDDWVPSQPDFQPGDWVYTLVDNGYDNAVHVGAIDGEVDLAADTISGTIHAPWLVPDLVAVNCEIHKDDGPDGIRVEDVNPDGGTFFCDFGGVWDIQPDHNVAVNYEEPDTDRVQTHFQQPVPDLNVEKWVEGHEEVAAGGPIVFALRYRNEGDAEAETIVLTDTIPANTAYVADSSGVTLSVDGDQVTWTLGPLQPREEARFHLVLANSATSGDTLTNQADIYTLYDREDHNNHAEAKVHVAEGHPDLYVEKHRAGAEPVPGQTFLYEIDYGNNGPVPSGPASLTDTLPEGTTVVSWYSRNGYNLWTEEGSGDQLVLTAPSIPGHWGDTLQLRLRLDAGVQPGTLLTNTVEIDTAGDTDPGNDWHERQDGVSDPYWNAGTDKRFGWGVLAPGREVGYSVHVRNHGNMAGRVLLTDTLPAGTSFVEAWRSIGPLEEPFPPDHVDDEIAVWDLGVMEPGAWFDLNVRVAIDASVTPGTVITNCANVAISGDDQWPFDDESCVADRVNAHGPNLRVYKEHWWQGDGQVRYDIYVENLGTKRLENVWLTDTYPVSTEFHDDWNVGHGPWITLTHDAENHQLIFWAEELDPGNTAHIEFRVDLEEGVGGEQGLAFTNTVEAPIPGDVYPPDNVGQVTAYTGPDLYAEKWVQDGELRPGERVTFTVLYGNHNQWPWEMSDATEVRLTERLPEGMTYAGAFWPDGNPNEPDYGGPTLPVIVWDMDRLGGEDDRWFYLLVDLDSELKPGQVLLNELEIEQRPDVDLDPIPENNTFLYPLTIEGAQVYLPIVLRNR